MQTSRRRRPLVLDAGALFVTGAGATERALAERLSAAPFDALVRTDGRGIRALSSEALARRLATVAAADPFETVRAWLLGQGPRPDAPLTPWGTAAWRGWLRWSASPALPQDGVVLAPGLAGWDAPRVALAGARPDVAFISVIEVPTTSDWPEYASDAEAAVTARRLVAMAERSAVVVVPDEASRDRLHAAQGVRLDPACVRVVAPRVLIAPTDGADDALAGADYVIAIDRIEARANVALLLHLWRDLLRAGGPVPKLVLAGERGALVEEIRPLLDWNEEIRRHVVEAPGLSPKALMRLALFARAVLSPSFARAETALLSDVAALGTPMIAADTLRTPDSALRLSPIDGPAWREAILAASANRAPRPRPSARGDDPVPILLALAATLR